MSIQLGTACCVEDLGNVKKFLFPLTVDTDENQEDSEGDWNDWGWKVEDEEKEEEEGSEDSTGSPGEGHVWLQDCKISLSPANDLLAIGYDEKLVILSQKYTPDEGEMETKFCISWQGVVKQEEGEKISSLLCLPLASQKRSTQGGPDWTCVIVGFSSGYVRFYTETGVLLLSQLLHEKMVQEFKCKTYEPPRHAAASEQHEELTILYPKSLVTIDGFSLFQTLRACRNQVARAAASGSDTITPPPLAYKKWGLQEQDAVTGHVSCGVVTPCAFDQLETASLWGGYSATIKPTPPAAAIYTTTGSGPFVGFFHAMEGSAQPLLSDVAYAVAHKLKSAFLSAASGWFGIKHNTEENKERHKPKVEPATPLFIRSGLPDKHRQGESIVLSPNNNLAAVTDSYGRVLLVDILKGRAVRMWKGYRDAQVGWVQVKEDPHEQSSRLALFLVIYAPRRGLLEVWTAEQGPRVAAFSVSKWCQLLYQSHGMLGLNNVTIRGVKQNHFMCYLLDPHGNLSTVDVPFHLALSDKNSKRARDVHLLKKLKAALRQVQNGTATETELISLLYDIKIASIRQQGLEKILTTRHIPLKVLVSVVSAIVEQIEQQDAVTIDVDSKMLLQFCKGYSELLNAYSMLDSLNAGKQEETVTEKESTEKERDSQQSLQALLSLTQSEVEEVLDLLNKHKQLVADNREHKVKFAADSELTVTQFLNCFTCHIHRTKEDQLADMTYSLNIRHDLNSEMLQKLGSFLFKTCLNGNCEVEDVMDIKLMSKILPEQVMSLLWNHWLSETFQPTACMERLYGLVKAFTERKDLEEVVAETNRTAPWWEKIRAACSSSSHIGPSLMLAQTCRSVSLSVMYLYRKNKDEKAAAEDTDMSEWEAVTLENEKWNILVQQLEDLLLLECLLRWKEADDTSHVTKSADIEVSVNKVLEGGRGIIAEIIAKWASARDIGTKPFLPYVIRTSSDGSDSSITCPKSPETSSHLETDIKDMMDLLHSLHIRFPHSLEQDVLYANCAWEYGVRWNKDPEVVSKLRHSLDFLKLVQNGVLQHGICSLMWQMFFLKKLQAAAKLIEKVGKVPKERLCRKEVGISDLALTGFLANICDFIEIMMQANCDYGEMPILNLEDLWQGVGRSSSSLAELAIDQRNTNYLLLKHHLHLCIVMQAVMTFSMKSVKPLSLFDTKGQNAFFCDLTSHPYIKMDAVDMVILRNREQFAVRVISQAIQMITDPADTERCSCAKTWCLRLCAISDDFCIDADVLRRQYTCELYSSGYDKLAEEALLTVTDHEIMGSQLLLVAGQRLAHFVLGGEPETSAERLSKLSPRLSTWLKTQDSSTLRQVDIPLHDTASLIGHIINQLPEGHSEYELAVELVELIQTLQ